MSTSAENTGTSTTSQHASRSAAARGAAQRAIIVVAAGSGTRLGAGMPKALVPLRGRPLLAHALDTAVDPALAARVVVVTPPGDDRLAPFIEAAARAADPGVEVISVPGGESRQESVAAGLAAIGDARRVLVHDAARALTSSAQFERVIAALADGAVAAVPGLSVVDTIKIVDRQGRVTSTPERARLRAVQTPQGFDAALLRRAHEAAGGADASDDAALMESAGAIVQVVPGEEDAFKVTHQADLERAERVLSSRETGPEHVYDWSAESEASTDAAAQPRSSVRADAGNEAADGGESDLLAMLHEIGIHLDSQSPVPAPAPTPVPAPALGLRVGLGIDVHAFSEDPADELWLAGLHWPGERGLSGHSDGDAVAHAACDALFSAAGIGDLGTHFGTSRPEYAGASGARLLGEACRLVREAGFEIENVSVQFVGNRPKFSPRRTEADAAMTAIVGAPVSVIATTSDGLGFEGAGEGISARAVAVLRAAR